MSGSKATAIVGGIPTVDVDIPILSVFIALFIAGAASHMTLFQKNNKRGHKFVFNGAIFGFCMSRILACVLRLVWATRPTDANITIAAQIFNNAGILLIYVINNFFVQRMIRARIPQLGWNRVFRLAYKVFLWLLLPIFLMVVVAVPMSLKTTDLHTKQIDGDILRAALTYITVVAALPLVLLPIAAFWPSSGPIDHFGHGHWHMKTGILFLTTAIACIEAGFRAGTTWSPTRLASHPAWFDSKAAFYCFGFMLDIFLVAIFLVGRVDQRFHIPDGADGPGSYSLRTNEEAESNATRQGSVAEKQPVQEA